MRSAIAPREQQGQAADEVDRGVLTPRRTKVRGGAGPYTLGRHGVEEVVLQAALSRRLQRDVCGVGRVDAVWSQRQQVSADARPCGRGRRVKETVMHGGKREKLQKNK